MADTASPLVSVVIPVFDGARFLADAIESVLAQDYEPFEVVVVDDGSTDDTAAVAERFVPGVRLLRHQRNEGPSVARNTGVAASCGELLAFLDADDLMAPGRLRTHVEYLGAHPEVGYVYGLQEIMLEPGQDLPHWLLDKAGKVQPALVIAGTVRRSVFERVGPFDPSLRIGEDMEWIIRCRASGTGIALLEVPAVRRRVHDRNVSHESYWKAQQLDGTFVALHRLAAQRRAARRDPPTA